MDGGKRRLRMGRIGGCINGWTAHEWRAEEMGWAVQLEGWCMDRWMRVGGRVGGKME